MKKQEVGITTCHKWMLCMMTFTFIKQRAHTRWREWRWRELANSDKHSFVSGETFYISRDARNFLCIENEFLLLKIFWFLEMNSRVCVNVQELHSAELSIWQSLTLVHAWHEKPSQHELTWHDDDICSSSLDIRHMADTFLLGLIKSLSCHFSRMNSSAHDDWMYENATQRLFIHRRLCWDCVSYNQIPLIRWIYLICRLLSLSHPEPCNFKSKPALVNELTQAAAREIHARPRQSVNDESHL